MHKQRALHAVAINVVALHDVEDSGEDGAAGGHGYGDEAVVLAKVVLEAARPLGSEMER